MGWGHSSGSCPRINTYAEALARFENTKPIRGSGVVPLAKRADNRKFYMRKTEDGSIQCFLYRTPCVTYHPSGSMTVTPGGWYSNTTTAFIWAVAKVSIRCVSNNQVVAEVDGRSFGMKGSLTLDAQRNPIDPVPLVERRLNRATSRDLRKKAKPFLSWTRAVQVLEGRTQSFGRRQDTKWGQSYHYSPAGKRDVGRMLDGDDEAYTPVRDAFRTEEEFITHLFTSHGALETITLPIGQVPTYNKWNRRYL